MKILIAPDKFKGSLTAPEAAAAIRQGLERGFPGAQCRVLPIADGGEGTAEVLCEALGGDWITAGVSDPLGAPIEARYGRLPDGVAVIAASAASGLHLIPPARRDLLRATTFGTGQLIADAARRGARQILLGLGGSATNDGGLGLAAALGFHFFDAQGRSLAPLPISLPALANIARPDRILPEIIGMCDVENPLLGPCGATRVYGPQKGGQEASLGFLEGALSRLADVVQRDLGVDFRATPGAGAAGGLGFGLMSFCGARLRPGFAVIADALGLPAAVAECDVVVTGEGSLDAQTLHGKGPAGIAALARQAGKPVIAFAGQVSDRASLLKLFDGIFAIKDDTVSVATAIREAATLLEQKAADAAGVWPY